MNLLLDTHVLLWALGQPGRLAGQTRAALADRANPVMVSAASVWEVAIKQALGRLTVPQDFERAIDRTGFQPLVVTFEHALAAGALPLHHRDPFDRMLIAQAGLEGLTIVTGDPAFRAYGIPILLP